jgi:hypothetical protein
VDFRAGALHGMLDESHNVFRRDLVPTSRSRHVVVEQFRFALELLMDGAHGDRARDFTRRMAPHAVSHHEERKLLVDEEVVLVVVAHLADVRSGVKADRVAQPHSVW